MQFDLDHWIGHSISLVAILGSLAGVFPVIAAFAGLIWYGIQIYESRTFQHWWRNKQMKKRAKRLAKLRAREKVVVAQIAAIEKVRAAKVEAREIVASAEADAKKLVASETAQTAQSIPPI